MAVTDILPPVSLDREPGLRRRLAEASATPLPGPDPLRSGIEGLKATGHGLRAGFDALIGDDAAAEAALQDAAAAEERAKPLTPRIQGVDQIHSATDAVNYATDLAAQQLPNLAVTALGAFLGRGVGRGLAGTAGATAGTVAGATAAGTGLESGQIFGDIASDPEARKTHSLRELAGTAAGFGLGAGAIDALPVARVFDKFGVGRAGREALREGFAKRAAKGAVTNAATEGATEGVQTAIERGAHKFVNDNHEVFGEDGRREILNAVAAGATLGGALGPIEGLAAPRTSIEERMAKLGADEELRSARGKAQIEALRDIPELAGQLDAFDTTRPDHLAEIDGLAANYDRVIGARRDPLAVIRSHVKEEHLADLDAPALDAISKLATGDLELTPQIRQLLEPRFHYFNEMIDQVRGLYGLKPEGVEIEGTQSGLEVATGDEAAELTRPAVGDDGQAARDEQGNLVRPAETQGSRQAQYRFQGDLDGAASLDLTNQIHGGDFLDTSTRRELLRLRDDDPNTDYDLAPLDEAVRDELRRRGFEGDIDAELDRRGQARFEQALAKVKDPAKQARLQALFDPKNPAAFLKHFEVIREQGLAEIAQQGDEDVLTHEDTKADKDAQRKAIFGQRARNGQLYDGQFLVQDGKTERAVVAPRLVRRMLQKQGVADLDNPTISQIQSAWAGGINALSKRGMKTVQRLSDNSTVAYSGGKRVVYGELKNAGQKRLEARVAGLVSQEGRIGAQQQTQDTLMRAGKVKQDAGVAKIHELGGTYKKIYAERKQTEQELVEAKTLRGKAQELETEIGAAEQQLVRDLVELLPKTAARVGKAFEGRSRSGIFERLHEALTAIESRADPKDKKNRFTQAAEVLGRYLGASRQAHSRLDALARKLEKLGVVYTSPRLEGFKEGNAEFADAKRAEEQGEERATVGRDEEGNITQISSDSPFGEFRQKERRHVTSDTKLAAVRKLNARRDAVETLIGVVAYTDKTFEKAVAELKRVLGKSVEAELKRAGVKTREQLAAWLERQRAEIVSTSMSLIDSTEGRFDQDGVDAVVGHESRAVAADRGETRARVVDVLEQLPDTGYGGQFFDALKDIIPKQEDGLFQFITRRLLVEGKPLIDWLDDQQSEITVTEVKKAVLGSFDALSDSDIVVDEDTGPADNFEAWDDALRDAGVEKLDAKFVELQKTLDGWTKSLGMSDLGINLVKPSEMSAFMERFLGPEGAERMMVRMAKERGVAGVYYPGANVIMLSPFADAKATTEVLAHEFGHAIFANDLMTKFASKDPKDVAQTEAVVRGFLDWREKNGRGDAEVKVTLASKKAFLSAARYAGGGGATLNELDQKTRDYVLDFNEWFADQVSRALTREGKPQNLVEKFFAELLEKVKKFLGVLKGSPEGKFLPDRSVAEFLQAMFHERRLEAMDTRSRPSEADLMDALYQRYREAGERGHTGRQKLYQYLNKAAKGAEHNRGKLASATRALGKRSAEGHYSREAASAGGSQQHAPFSEQTRLKVKRAITSWLRPEERRVLGRAFSSPHVMRQLRAVLRPYPVILDRVERDPLEALSYGYQLWMAGEIDIGPKTQNLFQSFHDFIEELFGLVSDGKEAENVLRALAQNLDAGARDPLLNILEGPTKTGRIQRAARLANRAYKDVHHFFGKAFYTASSRMYHTGNPVLRQMADLIQPRIGGEGARQGMLEARRERIGRFMARRAELLDGVDDETKTEALKLLQNPKATSQNAKAVELRDGVRRLLRDVFQYMKSKGVEIGDLGPDFFPWVFDQKYLMENAGDLRALLLQEKFKPQVARMHFLNLMERPVGESPSPEQAAELGRLDEVMRRTGAASARELSKTISVADIEYVLDKPVNYGAIVDGVVETIAESGGVADVRFTSSGALHRTPYMSSLNPRHLNWLETAGDERDMAELAKFFTKDLDTVLVNYTHQAVKRAEFVSRFGAQGERIDEMLKQARELGATHDDMKLAEHFMAAVMGTLGTGTNERLTKLFGGEVQPGQVINPKLRLGMSAAMVVQNMAVLGLATFTSLADPVGILVRSGSLREGLVALKAGGKEIMAAVRKEKTDLRSLAEALGSIEDSALTEALEWEYGSTYLTPGLKMANEFFFRTIGLTQWTRITRLMALAGAREFLKKHGLGGFSQHSARYIEQLGLEAGDVVIEDGELKILTRAEREAASAEERARDDRVRNALGRFVDESILRPNATQRPIWASDPHWMLIWHLKSFTYSFYETILKRSFNELGEKNLAPALMLSLFVPVMMAADLLRELFTEGELDDDKDLGDRMALATERSGLTGLKQFLLDGQKDVKYGGLGYESFAGPSAAMVARLPELFSDDSEKRWDAFSDQLPYQNIWKHWIEGGRPYREDFRKRLGETREETSQRHYEEIMAAFPDRGVMH